MVDSLKHDRTWIELLMEQCLIRCCSQLRYRCGRGKVAIQRDIIYSVLALIRLQTISILKAGEKN